jgi:DNA-binding response OmpR family regulator
MIAAHFRERGFTVDAMRAGADALAAVTVTRYDAVILDIGLPDIDGLEVLRRLRAGAAAMVPVLILTARDRIDNRVAGLDAGADDYILKPFDLTELDARVRAVLRRPGMRGSICHAFADLSFETDSRVARVGARNLDLTRRETALFEALIRSGDRIVVRDALADTLYGFQDDVSANALEATVSRLRRKLAALNAVAGIETMRGIGYRLTSRRA